MVDLTALPCDGFSNFLRYLKCALKEFLFELFIDKSELEAAQNYLEQAAQNNLVRIYHLTLQTRFREGV